MRVAAVTMTNSSSPSIRDDRSSSTTNTTTTGRRSKRPPSPSLCGPPRPLKVRASVESGQLPAVEERTPFTVYVTRSGSIARTSKTGRTMHTLCKLCYSAGVQRQANHNLGKDHSSCRQHLESPFWDRTVLRAPRSLCCGDDHMRMRHVLDGGVDESGMFKWVHDRLMSVERSGRRMTLCVPCANDGLVVRGTRAARTKSDAVAGTVCCAFHVVLRAREVRGV